MGGLLAWCSLDSVSLWCRVGWGTPSAHQHQVVSSELARCKDINIVSPDSHILLSKKGIVNSETQDNLDVTSAFDDKQQLNTHKQVQ